MTKPNFTLSDALGFAQSFYNVSGSIKELPSYEDQNFYIKNEYGTEFVIKIANSEAKKEILELQNSTIKYLSQFSDIIVSNIHPNFDNNEISICTNNNIENYFLRLVSYIPGTLYAKISNKSPILLKKIGKKLGMFTSHLQNFSHPKAQRDFKWNLMNASTLIEEKIQFIDDQIKIGIIKKFKKHFQSQFLPEMNGLRSSILHNDWNDYNIIIKDLDDSKEIELGLIDFGDINYGKTVFELAIALVYLMMDQEDPLLSAFHVIRGYNEEFPLTDLELRVLFTLICTRLCMSVCNSAHLNKLDPSNEYIKISEKPAWDLLFQLNQYPIQFAYQTFYDACNPGLNKSEILDLRTKYLGSNLSISYQNPLKVTRGFMQYLYDNEGRRYLDCVNNIPHVGHSNPEIVEVIQKQSSVLNTNTRYLHDNIVLYAKRLCDTLPESLSVCYFVNSGSEANELALRLAYNYTKQRDMVVVEGGYHGNTHSLIEISSYKFDGKGGSGPPAHVHKVPVPDTYRGQFRRDDPQAGEKYANYVRETIKKLQREGKGIAGFISESIMGSGGQIVFPENYLKEVYCYVRDSGGVCIADEVQVGFGRVGSHFWGFEIQGVTPDIVTIGKPMANGHPMGGVITTRKIADAFDNGMEFFSSFGGNPVSCAIGLKVLEIIEKDKLQENAVQVGTYLFKEFEKLKEKYPIIGDIRGFGLFIGIELVNDSDSLQPAKTLTQKIVENMREMGILLSADGMLKNVIKIKPPLIFSIEDAKKLVYKLEMALKVTN